MRAVAGAGVVEKREDVGGAVFQGVAEPDQFGQLGGDAGGDRLDHAGHEVTTKSGVGAAVGLDEALVDAPGGFDLDMVITGEQVFESGGLFVGEQISPRRVGPGGPDTAGHRGGPCGRTCLVGRVGGICRQPRRRAARRGTGPPPLPGQGAPRRRRS